MDEAKIEALREWLDKAIGPTISTATRRELLTASADTMWRQLDLQLMDIIAPKKEV